MRKGTTRGFARTSNLLRDKIRELGETRGFAVTRVLTHWSEIIGEDIAAICKPVDIKYGRNGFGATLTVLTTGAQAPMLEMQKDRLRDRVNAVYGYNAIAHLRITQTAPIGFSDGRAMFANKPKQPPKPDAEAQKAARVAARNVHDDGLRAALERLGENVITRSKH